MPDKIGLLRSLLDLDGRTNSLIFGKKTAKVGLHNMWCQGAEKQERSPQVYLMLSCSLTLLLRWPIIKSILAQRLSQWK